MAEFKLSAGASIDLLTKHELDDSLRASAAAEWIERGRGVKHLARIPVLSATIASSAVTIPATGDLTECGPRQGYAWTVRRLSIDGLTTAADVVAVYKNEVAGRSRVAQFTGSVPWVTFGKGQFVLLPGDTIVCANAGTLASTGLLTVSGEATETPAELLWKVV